MSLSKNVVSIKNVFVIAVPKINKLRRQEKGYLCYPIAGVSYLQSFHLVICVFSQCFCEIA